MVYILPESSVIQALMHYSRVLKPDKEKSTEKIDGAVATIMALDRSLRRQGNRGDSVYDERGLLIL